LKPLEIGIDRLKVNASVGIYSAEKQEKQHIFVSAKLFFDSAPVEIDDMKHSVDYDTLSAEIRRIIALRHYELIENIALHVGQGLKSFSGCSRVSTRIDKPLAAAKNDAQTIYVIVEVD
jgi:7,8-dihydroneopterin aldolase/epimerase/oxygenase